MGLFRRTSTAPSIASSSGTQTPPATPNNKLSTLKSGEEGSGLSGGAEGKSGSANADQPSPPLNVAGLSLNEGTSTASPVSDNIAVPARTESPTNLENDDSSDDMSVKSAPEYLEGDSEGLGEPMAPEKRKPSRAFTLATEARERPVKARKKKNKPLASLTYEDVKLTEEDINEDIGVIWQALHLFLNSRMVEAEAICTQAADHRLYYSIGFSLIQAIKSLATFEPEDLAAAISCCKDSILITQLLRKKDHSFTESAIRLAKGSTSVNNIKAMTVVQRHAELAYAECTLLKAVLGIIYSGDFIAFLKEALNMRNAYSIYRTMAKYVENVDAANAGEEDPSIDQNFRSGVFLGNGLISLILSLLPSAVLKIMEVFGFTGDRNYAIATLMKPGRWKVGVEEPGMDVAKEGVRRPIADMILLSLHLVIASYLPVGGVDIPTAASILHYNLDRYPNGIFFLYFAGRLHSSETHLDEAQVAFYRAIEAQREYVQLGHICYWDLGLISLAAGKWEKGNECFTILDKESNWSKSIYAYAKAVTLYEQGKELDKVEQGMKDVPNLMQRIAGKSIPLEKYVARRSRKFLSQGNRLCLPGLELAYFLNCLGLTPRYILFDVHLDQVSNVLAQLHKVKEPASYGGGDEYWDDYCLAHLLRGIILRFIAFPEPYTKPNPAKSPIPESEAAEQAMISFNNVLKHGHDLVFDHHFVWFAHYELGRLYEAKKQYPDAQREYQLILSGKNLEISSKKGKGKVTLQNMAILRSNSALSALKEDGKI